MMKKLAAMLLTGVMAVSLAACGGSTAPASSDSAAADEAVEEVQEETEEEADATEGEAVEETANDEVKFVVGFDAEYPPYGYLDEATGDYTGFDLRLYRLHLERHDLHRP